MLELRLVVRRFIAVSDGAWLPAIAAVAVLIAVAVSRLCFPFDAGVYEANNWAPAQLLLAGQNPYDFRHALRPPYTVATYGPLYYVLVGLGLKLFGLQLWFGRLLSVVGTVAALWGVFRISSGLTGRREAGWLATSMFAAQFPLQFWIATQRPDLVALGFSLAGLAVALSAVQRGSARFLEAAGAAVLLAAAFHCRQTSVLAAALAGAWLLRWGGLRAAMVFAGLFPVFCLIPAVLLEATSAGAYSEQLWRMPSALPRRADVLLMQVTTLAQGPQFWVLIVCSGAGAIRGPGNWVRAEPDVKTAFLRGSLAIYAGASLAAALLTSSIPGSNVNYYLEAFAALAICAPLAVPEGEGRALRLGLALLALGALLTGARVGRGEWFRWASLPYQREVVRKIESLTTVSDPVYSDYPELVTAAGRTYYFNTIVPYDGRSERLRGVPDQVFDAGAVRVMVGRSPNSHRGFHRVDMDLPMPAGVYPLYLHLRDQNTRPADER